MIRRRGSFVRGAVLTAACLLTAVLAGCAGVSPERRKEAEARMHMGATYLDQRNLPMAMRELTRAAELDPGNPEIEMTLGLVWQARGDLAKAQEHLLRAIDRKPDYAEARNNLGIVLARKMEWDAAIREFEAAAANPMYTTPERAYYNLGEVHRSKGDTLKAEDSYRLAIRSNARYAPAYLALSVLLGERGRWREAEEVLARSLDLLPDNADAWMEMGRVKLRLSRLEEAAEAFRNVLANTNDPEMRKQAAAYVATIGTGNR